MKRIWFKQQARFNYAPLRAGLGLIPVEELDIFIHPTLCPKFYTTRTRPLKGEYYVVEGPRFKARPVEPRIEFKAEPVCLIDFKNKIFLSLEHHGFWHDWDYFTTYDSKNGHTIFPEYDLGIRGVTFEQLKDELLKLNPKTAPDTPFYVNRLKPLE